MHVPQSNPDSELSHRAAGQLRWMLELVGGLTLTFALGASTVVQARIWRAISNGGKDGEHKDFKIRTEARRLEKKKEELVEQEVILQKLQDAHERMQNEMADVKSMHDHEKDATDVGARQETNAACKVTSNPILDE